MLALLLIAAMAPEESRQFRVAQAALEDKIYDVADRQFQEFIQKFPQSERIESAYFLLGQAQVNLGKWEAGVKTLQDAASKWPDKHPDGIQFWLGEAYSRGGKFAEAEARYADVPEKNNKSRFLAQALYGQAYAQFKQSKFPAASQTLDKLIKSEPKEEIAVQAELLRGQIELAQNNFDKAEELFKGVAQKSGNGTRGYFLAHLWWGEALARHGQPADAIAKYAVITDTIKAAPSKAIEGSLAGDAWFRTGWAQWQLNKYPEAAEAFSAVLPTSAPDSMKRDALLKVAEAYAQSGKVGDGVAKLKEFLQARPKDLIADEVQLAIGNMLFGKGDYTSALPEFLQQVTNYTNSAVRAKAFAQAGWSAWQLKKLPEALGYFQQALPLLGGNEQALEVLLKIADTQFALGRFPESIDSYQQTLKQFPKSVAKLPGVYFQLGEAYRRMQKPKESLEAFQTLVRDYPQSEFAPQGQYNIGQLLSAQGQEMQARQAYTAVVSNFPASVWASNAALAVGESYSREGKYDKAIAEFDSLAASSNDTELAQQAFYNRGWCFAMTGKRDKTLADFLEFLKSHPQAKLAPDIQYWVGDEYLRQRDYVKAQTQFQSLAETYPSNKVADVSEYFAGRAAYARQDYKTAVELYEAVLKKFPQSTWRCEARFGQGDALSQLKQFDDALLVFDSLTKDFPDCSLVGDAYGRKGDCQFTLGRPEDALVSYRKALELATDPSERNQALFKLGQTHEQLKKPEEAIQNYSKAMYETVTSTNTNEPPEHYWSCKAASAAALLKEQANQWQDAIAIYERLGKICPDLKPMADDKIRKIKSQHVETLFSH